ncbi:hypothetical protein [Streptomyces sp. NPDC002587]
MQEECRLARQQLSFVVLDPARQQPAARCVDHHGVVMSLADVQSAGVPAGRWMGRGLGALGLVAGQEVTEELRNLFGGGGRNPDAERLVAERLAVGDSPKVARRAGALGRRVKVVGEASP